MLNVLINTTPLKSGHAIRGIGQYTAQLLAALRNTGQVSLEQKPTSTTQIIHFPFFDLFFPTLPLLNRLPTVVTIHDVIPLLFPQHYPVGIKGKLAFFRQKIALKTIRAIITDSQASKATIIEHLGIKPELVHVVYLAGNPNIKPASINQITQVRNLFSLPFNYILYVGDINYNKNVPGLIKALDYLDQDIHLVCVGKQFYPHPIPEWEAIDRQLAISQTEDRVHFITTVAKGDDETLSALYSGASVYVQPSFAEGFGLPVLEAMQAQTPVVAAQNSSLPEVGGKHVVYSGTDPSLLAESIVQVLSWSKTKRHDWVKKAQSWAAAFTWKNVAHQTLKVYQQVLPHE